MNRFYIETELDINQPIELTESVFHHWVRVLRAKEQEQAIFFNGKGGEYLVTLTEINKKMHLSQLITLIPLIELRYFRCF